MASRVATDGLSPVEDVVLFLRLGASAPCQAKVGVVPSANQSRTVVLSAKRATGQCTSGAATLRQLALASRFLRISFSLHIISYIWS